jgi:hypothetical protein
VIPGSRRSPMTSRRSTLPTSFVSTQRHIGGQWRGLLSRSRRPDDPRHRRARQYRLDNTGVGPAVSRTVSKHRSTAGMAGSVVTATSEPVAPSRRRCRSVRCSTSAATTTTIDLGGGDESVTVSGADARLNNSTVAQSARRQRQCPSRR